MLMGGVQLPAVIHFPLGWDGSIVGVSGGGRQKSAECCRVTHISNPPRLAFKKCRKVGSEHVDLAKCLRRLRVPLGHKREVARCRGGRRATGSPAHRRDQRHVN